ncbi:MAG: TetR/AcrR family transcriptional regulator [Muribaculaceae bacterium]|nr:TetR/AcrR family transcriptional regulator [Muribaculaceae bacterium]MEE1022488.1 TetR/AcrR family transcriptional regulator [Muribaculaceae bacterium]
MVKKTRDKFIEVARQLFARKGVENTTMHDIASASDKGRRTIYTYFKSKRDIFNAVIERETDQLLCRLQEIVKRNISPERKLEEYVACRFETMREIVSRNGSLRAGFFRDVRKVDRARKLVSRREIDLLCDILREGKTIGAFEIDDCRHLAVIIIHAIQGLDVPYIRDNLTEQGISKPMLSEYISHLILYGLKKRRQ